jgi:hypothetical protein
MTEHVLVQIRAHGWIVKTFRVNGTVEMHAVDSAIYDRSTPPASPA